MILSNKRVTYLFVSILILAATSASAQKESYIESLQHQNRWVDSVYRHMNRRHRIAQLFFIRALTSKGQAYEDSVAKVIRDEQVGGIIFFQGGPVAQVQLTNRYQKLVKVPLLVGMDGEWGTGMRLDSTISFPFQMALGAVQDNRLIYKMGQQVAMNFKRLGMQMNLAPDMDINNNPNNPVINYRSFGDNKYNVAAKGIAYMKGMQDEGLLTTAKHFPGHGDTNVDSHLALPLLPFTRERLDTLEEYPFREAINAGISGIMVAHMDIPALDNTKNLPSTLSRPIITGILKDSLGFKGLVVSDAMEMKAVTNYFPAGEADVKAFIAGNDVIELSENSARGIKLIRRAIRKGKVSKKEFETRVKKVLAAKYWAGLNHYKEVSTDNLVNELNRPEEKDLVQTLSDQAVTLLKGNAESLQMAPIHRTAIVSIGVSAPTVFQHELSRWYLSNTMFEVPKDSPADKLDTLLALLKQFDQVYVSINDTRPRPLSKLDYSSDVKTFIGRLAAQHNTVFCVFANPYTLSDMPGIEKCSAILECYQMTDDLERSAVKVITRMLNPAGRLSVTVDKTFTTGMGIMLP